MEGPTTTLTFLGSEIDTMANQLRVPHEKLGTLQTTICEWMNTDGWEVEGRRTEN